MAILCNKKTGEEITLLAHHIFGRHADGHNTIIEGADVSRFHAVVFWDGETWTIKDTSANGTFVNGMKIEKEASTQLLINDELRFGSLTSNCWVLINTDEPKSMLLPLYPALPEIELFDIVALPSEDSPEVTLYLSHDGGWVCESPTGVSTLESGDLVGVGDKLWRFYRVNPSVKTQINGEENIGDEEIRFIFDVSQNEEHVSVKIIINKREIELGERSHHYLLLVLARQRLLDTSLGIDEREQGWTSKETLSKALGMSEEHINIQVYRFRKQLVKALPEFSTLHQLIERRVGEIRFAYDAIQIKGGNLMPSYHLLQQ